MNHKKHKKELTGEQVQARILNISEDDLPLYNEFHTMWEVFCSKHNINENDKEQLGLAFFRTLFGFEGPIELIKYLWMLYPQYKDYFDREIPPAVWMMIYNKARSYLKDALDPNRTDTHRIDPKVLEHWKSISDGNIPFGYVLSKQHALVDKEK